MFRVHKLNISIFDFLFSGNVPVPAVDSSVVIRPLTLLPFLEPFLMKLNTPCRCFTVYVTQMDGFSSTAGRLLMQNWWRNDLELTAGGNKAQTVEGGLEINAARHKMCHFHTE